MFHSSPNSDLIDREFQLSMMFDDIVGWGPEKVEKSLRFSFPPFLWKVAVLDEWIYVIECPSEDWLISATKKKWLKMEGYQFPILRWDASFNAGRRLTSVWVRLIGFPYKLWSWEEFDRFVSPFGAVVLELDPGTRSRHDYRFARIRLGIGDLSTLPAQHNLTHRAPNGFVSSYDIDLEVETPNTEPVNAWRGRLNGRPFANGTPFGVLPPPIPPVPPNNPTPAAPSQPLVTSHLSNMVVDSPSPPAPPRPTRISTSAPPVQRLLSHGPPIHTPNLTSPALPRRRGGVIISDNPSPSPRPTLGASPSDKGKALASGCNPKIPTDDIHDYDDESDDDSFQRALAAVYKMETGGGSTSGVQPPTPPPPPSSQTQPHSSKKQNDLYLQHVISDSATADFLKPSEITHSVPLTPVAQDSASTRYTHPSEPINPASPLITSEKATDSDSEPIQNIIDEVFDAVPLSVRAKRLQKAKSKNSQHTPKPTGVKQVRFTSPLSYKKRVASKSPANRKSNPASSTKTHRSRSVTKKICSSSKPEVIELSETSIEYAPVDTPEVTQEWRYNKTVPRRSFRFQVTHTHTPVLKRAQKRKASGPSKSAGNPLLDKFPYTRLTLDQITHLFQIYNIQLGKNIEERNLLIPAIQSMNRNQFEQLLTSFTVKDTHKDNYITTEHLQLSTRSIVDANIRDNQVSL